MTATAQPGSQPGDEQKEGVAASATSDNPTPQEPATTVTQPGPVSATAARANTEAEVEDIYKRLQQGADEHARYSPKGEPPKIEAPSIRGRRLIRESTDKVLAQTFFDRYLHLFATSNKELWVYRVELGRWVNENCDAVIAAMCMQVADSYYEQLSVVRKEMADARAQGREDKVTELAARNTALMNLILHCEKGGTMATVTKNVTTLAKATTSLRPVDMDHDRSVLAVANGVLDLRTKQLRHPQPSDYITRNTGVRYRYDADYSEFAARVLEIMGGNVEMASYLQRLAGYVLTGETKEQIMTIWHGEGGNGKNIIADALGKAMGTYYRSIPAGVLAGNDKKSPEELYILADLPGVRFALASEAEHGSVLKEAFIKSGSGDGETAARQIYGKGFNYQQQFKLVLLTNGKPSVRGSDDGIWRRIKLIPFDVTFGDEADVAAGIKQRLRDPHLLDRLTSDRGREDVLAWAVDGAAMYYRDGLREPACIRDATMRYRREEDYLGLLLTDVCEYIPPHVIEAFKVREKRIRDVSEVERLYVLKDVLYAIYVEWCEQHGHRPMSAPKFKVRILSTERICEYTHGDELREIKMAKLEDHEVNGKNGREKVYRYIKLNRAGERLLEKAVDRQRRERVGGSGGQQRAQDEQPRF